MELDGCGLSLELWAKATATKAANTKKKMVSFIVAVSIRTDAGTINLWPFYRSSVINA